MNPRLRRLNELRERHPLVAVLLALNLVALLGWGYVLGGRWMESRRRIAANAESTLRLTMSRGGYSEAEATELHRVELRAEREHVLGTRDAALLVRLFEAPNRGGRSDVDAKGPLLYAFAQATRVDPAPRGAISAAVVRFLEGDEPDHLSPLTLNAYRTLLLDDAPATVAARNRLYQGATGLKRRIFDDAIERQAKGGKG